MPVPVQISDAPRGRGFTQLRFLTILSLAMAAITAFAGAAQAGPQAKTAPVKYTMSTTKDSLKLAVGDGTIGLSDGKVVMKDNKGSEVWSMPLAYSMNNRQFPIDGKKTAANTVVLTPSKDAKRSTPVDAKQVSSARKEAAKSVAGQAKTKAQRDREALDTLNSQVQTGMTIGTLVGTGIGAVVGGAIGCALGATLAIFGCFFVGLPIGATVGGIAGTVVAGGGTLIGAGIQYFNTINAPFKAPKK